MRQQIKKALRHLGVDFVRWRPESSPRAALRRMLDRHLIDTVLDVGANEGQYARFLREIGFDGRIISFEPLTSAYQRLLRSAAKDASWIVAPRTALGKEEGEIRLNIASNGASSSLLSMLSAHRTAAPEIDFVSREVVPIARLDCAARDLLGDARNVFLKVDVQGSEFEVLQGAEELLPRLAGLQLELSFVPLYEGQALFFELADFVERKGFGIWGITPGFVDRSSGRLLQIDGIFFRG